MTETAVVNFARDKFSVEVRQIPRPVIGPDDVLLEVGAVSVCGSDLHQWMGTQSWTVNYPVVLGHEFAGTVSRAGDRVTGWTAGDRVVSETAAVIDPDSPLSRQGLYNLDPNRKGFGYGVDGAMTRFVRVPARCLHRIPDSLPFEQAALVEPCCVAYSSVVVNGAVRPGDRIVVLGPGPIGLLCAAMARLQGGQVGVAGLEKDAARLDIARQYGCVPLLGDAVAKWAKETDGLGADGVVDAAGISATLKTALQIVRPAGWISKVGWGPQPLDFSLDPLVQKNVTLKGSFSHNWPIWERVIRLLASGRLEVGPLVGGIWMLEQWRDAFEGMQSGNIVKAIVKP
ncbi:MAG: zinc-binding dehydrogenase [Lentisphaerae bacterium]|nr:zinc-binding dehydrogenase [Lentisphaerota bacterium]